MSNPSHHAMDANLHPAVLPTSAESSFPVLVRHPRSQTPTSYPKPHQTSHRWSWLLIATSHHFSHDLRPVRLQGGRNWIKEVLLLLGLHTQVQAHAHVGVGEAGILGKGMPAADGRTPPRSLPSCPPPGACEASMPVRHAQKLKKQQHGTTTKVAKTRPGHRLKSS